MEIAEFLLARIGEREAVAKAATPGPWFANGAMDENSQVGTGTGVVGRTEGFPGVDPRGDVVSIGVEHDGGCWWPDAQHVAQNDPAFVLAKCAADRRIVELNRPPIRDPETNGELHARSAHPAWEYATTEGPRKQWDDADVPPDGEGWERNVDAGRDGWERFDYTEESYWRRPRPTGPRPALEPLTLRLLALPYMDHPDYREEWKP